jgi:hypothetical protein
MSSSSSLHSSSVVHVTSSAARFITPSHTAVEVPESISIKDKDTNETCLTVKLEVEFMITYTNKVIIDFCDYLISVRNIFSTK